MSDRRRIDNLTTEELEDILYRRKRTERLARLRRLKDEGRLIEAAGLAPPNPEPPPIVRPNITPNGAMQRYGVQDSETPSPRHESRRQILWGWLANKGLLLVEIGAIIGFIWLIVSFLDTRRELNQELATLQQEEALAAKPVPATAAPIINVAVLPSGHRPPIDGHPPQPGEAGYIPEHLTQIINEYTPPPIPTPGPAQPRRIQIPTVNVDSTIVQGDNWEQLKKGVGQHIGSGLPGQPGNMVLSAHNDIYGEIFRHLDKLAPGDEIIVSTERTQFLYVVRDIDVVEPTDVWVMAETDHASATLISCYPYLINNKRIVIFADLAEELSG